MISCHICLGVFKYKNKHFHRLFFSINGSELNRPIWLEGKLPISVGLIRDADCKESHKEIELKIGEHQVEDNIGKYQIETTPS